MSYTSSAPLLTVIYVFDAAHVVDMLHLLWWWGDKYIYSSPSPLSTVPSSRVCVFIHTHVLCVQLFACQSRIIDSCPYSLCVCVCVCVCLHDYIRFKLCIQSCYLSGPHHTHSIHPINYRHLPRVPPRGRGLLPLPFLPPLRVPTSDIVYKNVTDSDSDTDCESNDIISTGLCEVLPPDNDVQCLKKVRQPSSALLQSSEKRECLATDPSATASLGTTHSTSRHETKQSISTESTSSGRSSDEFLEISSPFAAHSDPLQFTVRLPRSSREHWSPPVSISGATVPKQSPPWKEIRRDSHVVPPSTDYLYREVAALSRHHKLATEKDAVTVQPSKGLISQQPSVGLTCNDDFCLCMQLVCSSVFSQAKVWACLGG